MDSQSLQAGLYFFIALVVSLVLHELAHGWVALRLGDSTAQREGRLTLDPRSHLDPLGFLMLLVMAFHHFGFGWAKPVPVNPLHFKHPRRGFGIVAAAGPVMNIVLALLSFWVYLLLDRLGVSNVGIFELLKIFVWVNLGLASFNLLPFFPLDGQKVLSALMPTDVALRFDAISLRLGAWPLLLLVLWEWAVPGSGPLGWMIGTLVPWLESLLLFSSTWLT